MQPRCHRHLTNRNQTKRFTLRAQAPCCQLLPVETWPEILHCAQSRPGTHARGPSLPGERSGVRRTPPQRAAPVFQVPGSGGSQPRQQRGRPPVESRPDRAPAVTDAPPASAVRSGPPGASPLRQSGLQVEWARRCVFAQSICGLPAGCQCATGVDSTAPESGSRGLACRGW